VPGIEAALDGKRRDTVVAVSPIVAGAALKGPADRLLRELGHEASALGVARLYAPWVGHARDRRGRRATSWPTSRRGRALRGHRPPSCRTGPGGRPGQGGPQCPPLSRLPLPPRRAVTILPIRGIAEVRPGDDLASLLVAALGGAREGFELLDGDVLVVTQKIVSKAEGRLVADRPDDPAAKAALIESESVRILRRRGELFITETGTASSAPTPGSISPTWRGAGGAPPVDSDRSARGIAAGLRHRLGVEVGVIISDTFGRTWRRGVTDVAIGCAGVAAVVDLRGTQSMPAGGSSRRPRSASPTSWPRRPSS
jgi:coenzyme F420-0:L-glutamate ligase/coenzyme F420-1:gamma-L-glutamate ligase